MQINQNAPEKLTQILGFAEQTAAPAAKRPKVFRMVEGERTAGSIPVWEEAKTAAGQITSEIESALAQSESGKERTFSDVLSGAMAYNPDNAPAPPRQQPEDFGFGDLLDMINPLQHIPVVGHLYREITGDTIRPIGQIIGGGLFGGPLGVASALVNTVVEEETGKDMTGNALAMMLNGDAPELKAAQTFAPLEQSVKQVTPPPDYDATAALLALADLKSDDTIRIIRARPENA